MSHLGGPADLGDQHARVRDVVTRFEAALDSGDLRTAARLSTPDLELHGSGVGETVRGRDQLEATFSRLIAEVSDRLVGWEVRFDQPHRVELLGDVALVGNEGDCRLALRDGVREGPYRMTVVLVRSDADDGWLVRLFHGSEPQAW